MILPLHYVPLLSFRQPSSQARLPKFFGGPVASARNMPVDGGRTRLFRLSGLLSR